MFTGFLVLNDLKAFFSKMLIFFKLENHINFFKNDIITL